MTDDAGLKLLAAFEALAGEVRGMRAEMAEERAASKTLADRRGADAKRKQKSRDSHASGERASRDNPRTNGAASRDSHVTSADLSSLKQDLDQEQKKEPAAVTGQSRDYQQLVSHGMAAIAAATGCKYAFAEEDGKQVKRLIKKFDLAEAKQVIDLCVERYQREEFYRDRGLTFRLFANDANALRTARPHKASQKAKEPWEQEGFRSKEEWESYRAGLEAIT